MESDAIFDRHGGQVRLEPDSIVRTIIRDTDALTVRLANKNSSFAVDGECDRIPSHRLCSKKFTEPSFGFLEPFDGVGRFAGRFRQNGDFRNRVVALSGLAVILSRSRGLREAIRCRIRNYPHRCGDDNQPESRFETHGPK